MKTIRRYFGILIISIGLSSCLTEKVIPIDQMELSQVNLPEKVRKIALLSRNFKFDIDTLGQYYYYNSKLRKIPENESKAVDSIAVTRCCETLRKAMLESGRFDEIAVYPYSEIESHTGKNALPLSPQYVKKLCNESNTDAVVSIEMITYMYSLNSGSPGLGIPKMAEVKIAAIWAVYLPGNENPVDRFKYSDFVRWYEMKQSGEQKSSNVPPRTAGIKLACDIAAKKYCSRLTPNWSKSERVVVGLSGASWDKALALAQKYKWDDAGAIWQSLTENKNSKQKGAAALDLAVAKEMLGDYDQAAKWSNESMSLLTGGKLKKLAVEYSELLKDRKIKTDKLSRLIK
jgi:hypothetical protein